MCSLLLIRMPWRLPNRDLFVKLFYKNDNSTVIALWKFLQLPKGTLLCGFSLSLNLGPYFFKELSARGSVTSWGSDMHHCYTIKLFLISKARQCPSHTFFMKDGAPPYINLCVKGVLKNLFTAKMCHQPPLS